jgi:ribonuclease PH
MTEQFEFVEIQGSGEEAVFSAEETASMLALARKGITELIDLQKQAILEADRASPGDLAALANAFTRS